MISENPVYGIYLEKISSPEFNTNFFDVMKENGISACFSGHDHDNDFGGMYEGVELVYGRKTGFGSYGYLRGGRGIYLKMDIDGKATYNHDVILFDGSHKPNGTPTKRNPINK